MLKNFVKKIKEIRDLLRHNPNLILYGPPGTGKTYTAKAVAYYMITGKEPDLHNDEWEQKLNDYQFNPEQKDNQDNSKTKNDKPGKWAIVQFHPAYNYDDFVRGITVETDKEGQVKYSTLWKVLGEMSRRALISMFSLDELKTDNEESKGEVYDKALEKWQSMSRAKRMEKVEKAPPFILIIDEINRANLPAVLGELIYALEYRGEPVKTLYGDELIIPPNLYIIGTMNTADRSAGRIDYAIRRRFTFYPMHAEPDYDVVSDYGQKLMNAVNGFIEKNVSPDYDPEDIKIGYTYFISKRKDDKDKKKDIAYKFIYQVIPLLYEYIRDGLVNTEIVKSMQDNKERREGYKLSLSIDLETGQEVSGNEEKVYYLRGGRLYKDDKLIEMGDLWFMKTQQENQTQSQNGNENDGTGEQD